MKTYGVWNRCSLGCIHPSGWLKDFLLAQRQGLTGHLEHAGYPFNTRGWRSERLKLGERGGADWWPYEQTAYWIDGMIRCGILIEDEALKAKARRQIDHVMRHPDTDGYLGPDSLKQLKGERGSERWPHAVFFRAVLADHDERSVSATVRKLVRHYLSGTAKHETTRNVCNIEIMAWLYEQTGDRRLLDLAEASYRAFQVHEAKSGATLANMLDDAKSGDHGPTYMELFKLGAVMYRITGKRRYLTASENAQRKLERDHVLIDGVPSATEHLRGIYSNAGHETCVITDYLWSLGWLLQTTGKVRYADAMERIAFNALPGAVTSDFKALQYFSGPNQVIAGPRTNHHPHGIGSSHVSYRPNPATECCPGNVHRAMPTFVGAMWMTDRRGGLVAALYGPGSITRGRGRSTMTVVQETDYPFSHRIAFRFCGGDASSFAFSFRVPGWSRRPLVRLNGRRLTRAFVPETFATITRAWRDGDVLEVVLRPSVRMVRGPEDSVAFTWGPLVFSHGVEYHASRESSDARSSDAFPAWTLLPAQSWNYGITRSDGKHAVLGHKPHPVPANPWTLDSAPVYLDVSARKIPGWRLRRMKRLVVGHGDRKRVIEGELAFMPTMPSAAARGKASRKATIVRLAPYGSTRLRVTWFPALKPLSGRGKL
ncbi:MAG TPA: glycoside hydrolase family 127 protein [Kiritimatiellia bacterium]|nr:glycoside hydrolase family 127 protein [Kiritimatiellia bacterium]HMO98240.1 glycoside hydrolase family 127 protein [Kiritimatiellia bacterium]HMP98036.1 glycoside hydrolase family 127 protein [Kiritimatiellia bacterium]